MSRSCLYLMPPARPGQGQVEQEQKSTRQESPAWVNLRAADCEVILHVNEGTVLTIELTRWLSVPRDIPLAAIMIIIIAT